MKRYDANWDVFTCTSAATYSSGNVKSAGHQRGPVRIFVQGTKWPGVEVTKTLAHINTVKLMHERLGHIAPTTTKAVIRSGIQPDIDITIHDASVQFPTGSCSICAQAKPKKRSFDPQDQV